LQKELSSLYLEGYLQFTSIGGKVDAMDYRYRLSQKGKDIVDGLGKKPTTSNKGLTKIQDAILKLLPYKSTKLSFKELTDIFPGGVDESEISNNLIDLEKLNFVLVTFDDINITQQGLDYLSKNNNLPPTQPTTQTNLRPSPTDSATMYPTGRIKVGNDANLWKVTENKNGVKRWVKVGGIPSELPDPTNVDLGTYTMDKAGQTYRVSLVKGNKKEWVEVDSIANPIAVETPISEIDEDEVDLDILEQQLNDDSLEFDISDEDLDNLEF
jgi:hypothetical protein